MSINTRSGYSSKDRFLSVGLFFGFIFLLIVSFLVTTAIAIVFGGTSDGGLWHWVSMAINFVIFTFLFAAMYRFIPSHGFERKENVSPIPLVRAKTGNVKSLRRRNKMYPSYQSRC